VRRAASRALLKAGKSMLASTAMMAMTTSNSIRVKDLCFMNKPLLLGFAADASKIKSCDGKT
jgi:hypothetical protein